MTNMHDAVVEQPNERGSALVGVLLLLMLTSALAAALGASAQTETLISRNQRSEMQATAAAEAGLNHAVELATTYIFEWKANQLPDVETAIDNLLLGLDGQGDTADDGSLGTRPGISAAKQIPLGTRLTITNGIDAQYYAVVIDDQGAPGEDGDPFNDANGAVIVRATGYAENDTTVVLEALIGPLVLPAVLIDGDFTMSGNVAIQGSTGSVHANGDLLVNGEATTVAGTVTASGLYTGSPTGSGGAAELPVPEIRASDYLAYADLILTSSGEVEQPDGTPLCDASGDPNACEDGYGWTFAGADGWEISGEGATNTTFYVEGKAAIGGSGPSQVLQITVIAEGSIDISGNPSVTPNTPDLLFITDGDLEISGTAVTGNPLTAEGQMLVHEQVQLSGNPSLAGQLIVENATGLDPLVTNNAIVSGNVTITYEGDLGGDTFSVRGWREVRGTN